MIQRPRRLRSNQGIRKMVQETSLSVNDLIYPIFVKPGDGEKEEIASMEGQFRHTLTTMVEELKEVTALGIPAVLLFGVNNPKHERARTSYDKKGIVQEAIRVIKQKFPDLYVITDVCVCAYTHHGHCGIIQENDVLNDESLKVLAKMALSHAEAGADMVAPSAMMDGQIGAIRRKLDNNGYSHVSTMGYSAKYQSAFYGPFRDAADSAPSFGDRATYQMDIGNSEEAVREIALDIEEGADIVMVKPALSYLDIIYRAANEFEVPVAAYNVSGEFAAIKASAAKGWIDEQKAMLEVLLSIKRAGAKLIITYFAKDIARKLRN